MKQYLAMLDHVLSYGKNKDDRTGTGTLTVFDYSMRFDLADGFPLVTTKRMHVKSIIHELLWFIRGDTNIKYLKDNGVTIWDEWADQYGEVGPLYGKQWREWQCQCAYQIDQLQDLIKAIKTNPNSRRLLVSAWNVGELEHMKLPPCHFAFQVQILNNKLNMKVYLRSLDVFLGAPFDIASYAYLQVMLCHIAHYRVGELVVNATDVHLYKNHIEQAKLQLSRKPFKLPSIVVEPPIKALGEYTFDDLNLWVHNYQYWPAIKAPIAV